ncbi:protein SMALL AUXIN UP-REGULATED RNA 12-like [Diospyros lotus]|uniref:protein SMALL AUXIN UP-REGULATED RNA 12-like n=1 Tax=Diospyros lotus TaxID=55363 RepID=UPI0022532BBD|nr:protein SMALL AUXIN UP-REGULATED RNA 12-like [Diospyros lotus]
MSPENGNYNKIRHIVRIRQMLRRWRKKAASSPPSSRFASGRVPPDVPAGHVAICVGSSCTRFVVRATYLNHPIFKELLVQAEEEYGFTNQGPLTLPCDESLFEEILRVVSRSESGRFLSPPEDFQRCSHVGHRNRDILGESGPLLDGFAEKSPATC